MPWFVYGKAALKLIVGVNVTTLIHKVLITSIAALRRMMSKETPKNKKKISPTEAVKILRRNGEEITEKEAEKVLEVMYFLAKLIVNQNFKK